MDRSSDGVIAFFLGAVLAGLLGSLISYGAAQGTVRDQAIAAGVACYVSTQDGKAEFRWNCKQH